MLFMLQQGLMSSDPFSKIYILIYLFVYFPCIFPRFSVQSKLSRFFFFDQPPFSFSSPRAPHPPFSFYVFLCLSLSVKHVESRTFCFFHNGSFVFSEPKTKASSNVSLFYVTTEVAVTCWLLMNKYIYLASKPAYTVE